MSSLDSCLKVDFDDADRIYLNCEIESIPDFLQDHRLLDKEALGRLKEHCRRWTTLVNALQLPDEYQAIWNLRFRYVPDDGRVHIGFFGSLLDPENRDVLNGARRLLESFGIKLRELSSERLEWWTKRDDWKRAYAVEQRDEIFYPGHALSGNFRAPESRNDDHEYGEMRAVYLTTPFWGPGGVFVQPFNAMTSHNARVEIGVCIAPTTITKDERRVLSGFTSDVISAANDESQDDRKFDPTRSSSHDAEWCGRVYNANLRRLDKAFLCQVVVLSDESAVAYSVAKSIEAIVNEELPFEPPVGSDSPFYSRATVKPIGDLKPFLNKYADLKFAPLASAALEEFRNSLFEKLRSRNRSKIEKEGEEKVLRCARFFFDQFNRLRYLTDARGAATVFRFPVGVNSGVPGIDVRQRAPDFVPAPRPVDDKASEEPTIVLGSFESGGEAVLPLKAFRQHALITGFTGSGKTQTVLGLLHQFWNKAKVPFLVLEAAKTEYRGLLTVKGWKEKGKLYVYTLGNSAGIPFQLNPFEVQEGVRVELHVNRLAACFQSAFPQLPFLTSILHEALGEVYRKHGWSLTSVGAPKEAFPIYPTLEYFIKEVERITELRGYQGENAANIQAAIQGRLKILLLGSAGAMLNCSKSSDLDALFEEPTILELNDLNEECKSLATMFLLVFLREHRERHPKKSGLAHVTVVEEAHNILERTGRADEEVSANSKEQAVAAFCNMLTELRAYGEGLIIADQSPNKLAQDAMRNTNVQIAHQLRDAHDRDAVANAMIMSDEQRDFIGKLRPGYAAVFYTGLERATFIKVPQYYDDAEGGDATLLGAGFSEISDADLRELEDVAAENVESLFYDECARCPFRRDHARCFRFKVAQIVALIASDQFKMRELIGDSSTDSSESSALDFMRSFVECFRNGSFEVFGTDALTFGVIARNLGVSAENVKSFVRCFLTQLFFVLGHQEAPQGLIDRFCELCE